jgi:heptosyltransferase-3
MFEAGDFDVCTLFYSRFRSVIAQIPTAQQVIPAMVPAQSAAVTSYDYEPEENEILSSLLPRNISVQVFRALLENHPKIEWLIDEPSVLFSMYVTKNHPFDVFYNLHMNDLRSDAFFPGRFLENPKALELGLTKANYLHHFNLLEVVSQLADLGKLGGYPHIYLEKGAKNTPVTKPYWVIHRKSNAQMRDWQDSLWCQLLDQIIAENDVHVIEIGVIEPLSYQSPKFQSLVGKTSLSETLQIVRDAEYFIGVESGPAHIANAFRIPALILCGRFVNFDRYNVYSGAYQQDGIAQIVFNSKGTASELTFEDVYAQLPQKNLA